MDESPVDRRETSASDARNPVEALVEEFFARRRAGERLTVEQFAEQHPELAGDLRDLLPALITVEDLGDGSNDDLNASPHADSSARVKQLGDFHILREIGRGGMGVVYEAEQISLGRRVALKVLLKSVTLDSKHKRRFQREARAAARLHHTNIVPVFGVGEQDGQQYYVMQFIHGLSLDEVLVELKRLRESNDRLGCSAIEGTVRVTHRAGAGAPHGKQAAAGDEPDAVSAAFIALSLTSGQSQLALHLPGSDSDDSGSSAADNLPVPTPAVALQDTDSLRLADTPASGSITPPGQSEHTSSPVRAVYWQSVARIGVQVAEALQYAHDQGVIHRDVKPGNLLLDVRGTTWITDFGLAKANDQHNLSRTGDILGTLRYMAPEQFEGQADARSDVYGLGLTLYELLTMKPGFDERDRPKLIQQVTTGAPARLQTVDHQIPRDLATIVHKAIDRDPSHRYQEAAELAADLQRYLVDEPIRARPLGSLARCVRWCRRNPRIAGLTAAVSLLLLVVGIGGVAWAVHAETARRRIAIAEDAATHRLFDSYVAQAQASRWSRRPGQRVESLRALQGAAALLPRLGVGPAERLKLRNEALASMGLIDLENRVTFQLPQHDWWVTFDDEMRHYACMDSSDRLCIQSAADHKLIAQLPFFAPPTAEFPRRFACDGRFLIGIYPRGRCWAWDVRHEKLVLEVDTPATPAHLWQFSCASERLAVVARDDSIRIFDLPTAKQVQSLSTKARSVALHPDGSQAAVAHRDRPEVEIWDCQTARLVREFRHPDQVTYLAWSPDGRQLACGVEDNYKIYVWNTQTGKQCAELSGHQNAGLDLSFTHDSRWLVSASWDGTVRVWDPFGGRELLRADGTRCELHGDQNALVLSDGNFRVAVSRLSGSSQCRSLRKLSAEQFSDCDFWWAGPVLASAALDGLRLWDVQTGRELAFASIGKTSSIVFHRPTESLISRGPDGVYRWPITPSENGAQWRIGPPVKLLDLANFGYGCESTLVQCADGRRLAATIDYHNAVVFRAVDAGPSEQLARPDGEQAASDYRIALKGHRDIGSLAISPDSQWVAGGSRHNQGVKIWNAATGRLVQDVWPDCLGGNVAFSPDGKRLAASSNSTGQIRVWETGSWTLGRRFGWGTLSGHGLAWASDGGLIAVNLGNAATLIDPDSGAEVATVTSPNEAGNIQSIAFGPDDAQLAIVYRSAIEVWDLRSVRRRLAEMALDWDRLPLAPPRTAVQAPPQRVEFDLGPSAKVTDFASTRALIDRLKFGGEITKQEAQLADEALEELSLAIANDAERADAWLLRGRLNWALGRDPEALSDFTQAIAHDRENVSAYFYRARTHWWSHDLVPAIDDYEEVLRREPHHAAAALEGSMCYSLCPPWPENAARALELADAYLARHGDNGAVWHTKALALYRLERFDEAQTAIQRAIGLGATWLKPHLTLAAIHHRRGLSDRALEAFRIADGFERAHVSSQNVKQNHQWRQEVAALLGLLDSPDRVRAGEPIVLQAEHLAATVRATEGRVNHAQGPGAPAVFYLSWTPSHPGARLTYTVSAPQAGRYRFSGWFLKAFWLGRIQLSVNGQRLGDPFDAYAPQTTPSGEVDFGEAELAAGENEITLEVVGSHPQSDAYRIWIEQLKLTPVTADAR